MGLHYEHVSQAEHVKPQVSMREPFERDVWT